MEPFITKHVISTYYIHSALGNAEALVVASTEIGLEVNVDRTEYMNISYD